MIRFIVGLLAIVGTFAAIRADLVHIVPVLFTLSRDMETISKLMSMLATSTLVLPREDSTTSLFRLHPMSIIPTL